MGLGSRRKGRESSGKTKFFRPRKGAAVLGERKGLKTFFRGEEKSRDSRARKEISSLKEESDNKIEKGTIPSEGGKKVYKERAERSSREGKDRGIF